MCKVTNPAEPQRAWGGWSCRNKNLSVSWYKVLSIVSSLRRGANSLFQVMTAGSRNCCLSAIKLLKSYKVHFSCIHKRKPCVSLCIQVLLKASPLCQNFADASCEGECSLPHPVPVTCWHDVGQTEPGAETANRTQCPDKCLHVVQSQQSWATKLIHMSPGFPGRAWARFISRQEKLWRLLWAEYSW